MRKSVSRKRESIFLLMLTALVLFSIVIANAIIIYRSQKRSLVDQFQNVTERVSDSMEESLNNLNYTFTTFFMDEEFQNAATNIKEEVQFEDVQRIEQHFELLMSTNSVLIKGCCFIPVDDNDEFLLNNLIFSGFDLLLLNNNIDDMLNTANTEPYLKGALFYKKIVFFDGDNTDFFVLARNILSIDNNSLYQRIGLGVLYLSRPSINNILRYVNQFNGITAFIKADDEIIFSSHQNINYEDFNNKRYYSSSGSINFLNWYLETFFDSKIISNNLLTTYASSFIIMIVAIIGFMILYAYISLHSRQSLDYLFTSFSKIRDTNELTTIALTGTSDVDKVIDSYNDMVASINSLNEEISIEKEKSLMLQLESVEYQLNSLQSQINKHFLINVLNIIRSLVNLQNTEKAKYCIENLSEFLRYSLTLEPNSTIEKEIEAASSYLNIQLIRYPNIIYRIACDESLKSLVVPKVLLQPIIENCFMHGFSEKRGIITIRCYQDGKYAYLDVENDNSSLSVAEMDDLNNHIANLNIIKEEIVADNERHHGVALINIQKRLTLLYGPDATLRFVLGKDGNTIVRIMIPLGVKINA